MNLRPLDPRRTRATGQEAERTIARWSIASSAFVSGRVRPSRLTTALTTVGRRARSEKILPQARTSDDVPAGMTETDRHWSTVCAWRPAIEVLVVTNGRTE